MKALEQGSIADDAIDSKAARKSASRRVVMLFVLVIIGVLAAWFWDVGSAYLANKAADKKLAFGSLSEMGVRAGLAAVVACLTFPTIYEKIGKATGESWIAYFVAFQNGFFWQAVFEGVKETVVS